MSGSWKSEVWRLALIVVVAGLVGLLFASPLFMILVGLSGYLFWHLRNLYRLEKWLSTGRSFHPPESVGIWGGILDQLYRNQKSSRKQKKRLASILTRFQQATSALPDATVVLGARDEIEWFNEAARELLGLTSPADIGQRIENMIRHPLFYDFILRDRETDESIQIPSPMDDRITLNMRLVPYGKDQQLLVARDVSQRIQLEQMRRDFIANVSHELRTPLTVVNGYLETMQDSGDTGLEPWRRSIDSMSEQSARMLNIVEDLLFLSRLENERFAEIRDEVDVPEMLMGLRDIAEQLSGEKRQQVFLEMDRNLLLLGSEKELYSAFSNLINNAVRYTREDGEIFIRWYADEEGAHFEVSDDGIGIAPASIPRLTERFYRVDVGRSRATGGTGLGLAIVKHVLSRHSSQLEIKSRIGRGSTFFCTFPSEMLVNRESGVRSA